MGQPIDFKMEPLSMSRSNKMKCKALLYKFIKNALFLFFFLSFLVELYAKEIAVISVFPSAEKKLQTIRKAAEEEGISIKTLYLGRLAGNIQDLMKNIGNFTLPEADIYIFDIPPEEVRNLLKSHIQYLLKGKEYYILNDPPFGSSEEMAKRLFKYFDSGGKKNFRQIFRLLLGREAEPPLIVPRVGFYSHRDGVLENLTEEQKKETKVLILFHRADIVGENLNLLHSILSSLEKEGLRAFGFFYPEVEGLNPYVSYLLNAEKEAFPRVLINLRLMYFKPENERVAFEKLGRPVLGGITFRGKLVDWEKNPSGIPVVLLPFYYVLPEILGVIDPTLIGVEEKEKKAVEAQLNLFVKRIKKWVELSEKANEDKRVAIVYYNYPPGEGNILASHLNVVRSLTKVLDEAKRRGYKTEPLSEEELRKRMLTALSFYYRPDEVKPEICLALRDYLEWYRNIPEKIRGEIESVWGPPEREPLLKNGCFPIPEVRVGNWALLPLAPRGFTYKEDKTLYHSTKIPPSHYYLAFYLYLQKNFDILVSFGTHGTQEWTPGKERALDIWDFPYLTLGDLPVIYPYIVDNIGEALQAKRRGRAEIISHQTPAFAPSGTYGVLEELHQLLHKELTSEGRLKTKIREKIADLALRERIASDLGYKNREEILRNFETFSKLLHEHIHEIARQNMPLGLHTFGATKDDEFVKLTILQMLGKDWILKWESTPYEEFITQPLEKIKTSRAFQKIESCLSESHPAEECDKVRDFYKRLQAEVEIDAFFQALEAKYLPTSYGGDPIRNPESLPTGKNLYGFDPMKVPTEIAWKTAVEITEEWLRDYHQRHGSYPKKVAFSLWSTETMRHQGVVEAQILYLLGVKPRWDEGGRVIGLEIIPKEYLKRPRIDVVVSATGLYRDHFPNLFTLINQAVSMIANLVEENNRVAENTAWLRSFLESKGMDGERAKALSTIRVFSNEAGVYGTGLDEAVFKTKDRKELTSIFLKRMSFLYDRDLHGAKIENLFEENLKSVDAVILSRSSNLYGMLSTDDPFQYLGGLAMTVEILSGKRPEVFIANLRSASKMQSADDFLVKEVRSRYLNPEYLKAMMKEGASGVSQVLDVINNLYGWQVITPQVVKPYIWQELKEVLLLDKYRLGLKEWFKSNKEAYNQLVKQISEGITLSGAWQNQGYGLSRQGKSLVSKEIASSPFISVRGKLLKKFEEPIQTSQSTMISEPWSLRLYLISFIFFIILTGFIKTHRKEKYVLYR